MSNVPHGPGWWQASDGNWYPPQSATPPPPPPSASPPPPGPGWWLASDGRWYPPIAPAPAVGTATDPTNSRWFHHPLIVLPLVLLCFPIGLVLVWTSSWSLRARWGATGAFALLLGLGLATKQDPATVTTASTSTTEAAVTPTTTFVETMATTPTLPATTAAPVTAPPTAAPTTTIDPDVMCKAAISDANPDAAYNGCTPEQFDRIGPGIGVRVARCQTKHVGIACDGIETTTTATPAPVPISTPPSTDPPRPGGGTDPRFGTCREAIANGYGPYHQGQDPEYSWYRDADSDGIVCE